MANKTTTLMALIAGAFALAMAAAAPSAALAGGTAGCGCKPPPPPPPPPPPKSCGCTPVTPPITIFVPPSINVNVTATSTANSFAGAQSQSFISGGGGGASGVVPGPVTGVNLSVGGSERESYEAERTRFEKVVIQAFCFDDKDVPHPASQVAPDRDIDEAYDGEIYRCIAGSHMQVTIAQWREPVSFEGGQTLTCQKGEALYHEPGKGAGKLECRPQKPARDCNERSLLRRFGAGIKVLTMVYTEKYTAFRESSHESGSVAMSLDGGVGGIAY